MKFEKMHHKYVIQCAIWHHLQNLINVKNTHGEVLLLAKLQATSTMELFAEIDNR